MKNLFHSNENIVSLLIAISILIGVIILAQLFKKILISISERSKYKNNIITNAILTSFGKSATIIFVSIAFAIGKNTFSFPDELINLMQTSTKVLFTLAIGIWIYYLVEVPSAWIKSMSDKNDNSTGEMLIPLVKNILRVLIIALVFASLYQTISQKSITPFLASLGILGAAVALAAQDTFKNFFGSFVVISDRPFEVGERIVVNGFDGVVKSTGVRSTRLKTLDDHLVTIPNGVLANATIQNISKRASIKRSFTISITYDTKPEKIEEAIEIVKNILNDHEGMNPEFSPRVYFNNFGTSSLDIMVLYWYFPADYWAYMDFSEKVNFEILKQFNAAEIEFAFPTQNVNINQ